jgi:hypothetical protein
VRHFMSTEAHHFMTRAVEGLSEAQAREVYEGFLHAREEMIVGEIRRACGILE